MPQIYKIRTELSITSVSQHHTLKRGYLHLHSQLLFSSHLVLTNTTVSRRSVSRRVAMLTSFIESASQTDTYTTASPNTTIVILPKYKAIIADCAEAMAKADQ